MIVLGIDPGTTRIGYGLIKKHGNSYLPVAYGLIEPSNKLTSGEQLQEIHINLKGIIEKFKPDIISIEDIFYFKNKKTVIKVAQARGVILLTSKLMNIKIIEPTPLQVKQGITGYGRADKNQVSFMVTRLLGLKETPKPDDITDALAIAITGANFALNQI